MIDLKKVINEYPDAMENPTKLRSVLLDLYPEHENREMVELLAEELSCDVANQIKQSKITEKNIPFKADSVGLKNHYSIQLLESSVQLWRDVFPEEVNKNTTDNSTKNTKSKGPIHVHRLTKTVVEPTCQEKGYTLYQCDCGYEYRENYTPIADHNYFILN